MTQLKAQPDPFHFPLRSFCQESRPDVLGLALAEAMLRGEVKENEPVLVVRNGDKLEFKAKSPTAESGVSP